MARLSRCTSLAAALVAVTALPAAAQTKPTGAPDAAAAPNAEKKAAAEDVPAKAEDGAAAADVSRRCISLPNLDRTDVVDDRTIVFHMRDGRIYMNRLSRECPGLKRERRFMYSPTSSELCEIDGVTVIEKWAFGFTRGFTCSLGEFHALTSAEFEALMRPMQARSGAGAEKPADSAARNAPALRDTRRDAAGSKKPGP